MGADDDNARAVDNDNVGATIVVSRDDDNDEVDNDKNDVSNSKRKKLFMIFLLFQSIFKRFLK